MTEANRTVVLSAPVERLNGETCYKHLRLKVLDFATYQEEIYNHGGITVAYKHLTNEELVRYLGTDAEPAVAVGFAGCSLADNYDRAHGRFHAEVRLAKTKVLIVGERYITRLVTAGDAWIVSDFIIEPMAAQGIRYENCA